MCDTKASGKNYFYLILHSNVAVFCGVSIQCWLYLPQSVSWNTSLSEYSRVTSQGTRTVNLCIIMSYIHNYMCVMLHNNLLCGTALWNWSHQVEHACSDFYLLSSRIRLYRPIRMIENNYSITLAPWILPLQNKVPTNLEIFLTGYTNDSMVSIGPVHVISLLFDWVTRSLITAVLGLVLKTSGLLIYDLAKAW
jgi:hypothetical protein